MWHQLETLDLILNYFRANGWVVRETSYSLWAFKYYDSAVGKKEAQVYFNYHQDFNYSEEGWRISGQYFSKGQNILGNKDVLVPKDSNTCQILELCENLLLDIENEIANSYAVRLLRN